jgi:transposase InsO family protein
MRSVADITALPTDEGFLYLAMVLDAWSRRVVGWSMDPSADAAFVVRGLDMAIATRRPRDGLVHHSDDGSQYTSLALGPACARRASRHPWAGVGQQLHGNHTLERSAWRARTTLRRLTAPGRDPLAPARSA